MLLTFTNVAFFPDFYNNATTAHNLLLSRTNAN